MSKESDKKRLIKYSRWNGECLESTYKARSQNGYALVKYKKSTIGAHRLSWLVYNGEIPGGYWVLHKCDNPICINPNHLFIGTPKDNTNDMVEKNRQNFHAMQKYKNLNINELAKLKNEGMTYKEIGERLNIPLETIHSILRKNKDKLNHYGKEKYSDEIKKKAKELKNSGIKCREIQKILNIPKRSLSRILNDKKSKKN